MPLGGSALGTHIPHPIYSAQQLHSCCYCGKHGKVRLGRVTAQPAAGEQDSSPGDLAADLGLLSKSLFRLLPFKVSVQEPTPKPSSSFLSAHRAWWISPTTVMTPAVLSSPFNPSPGTQVAVMPLCLQACGPPTCVASCFCSL